MSASDWQTKRLDEVATVIRGVTYSSGQVLSPASPNALMLLRATNIQDGKLDSNDPVYIPRDLVKPTQMLQKHDIVIASSSGSIQVVGKSASVLQPIDATFGAFCTGIRATGIDSRYLAHYLQDPTLRQKWSDLASGSNINNLKSTDIASTPIPMPPLVEQKLIVETLDDRLSRLDKALADLEVAAQRSHHLFLAALEKAIEQCSESTYKPLGECLNVVDEKKKVQRGWSPQCLPHPQSDSSNWAVLKTTAVQNMRYEPQHNKELPKSLEPKTHLEVQAGDFLMTTTGPRNRCGVVCLVTSTPQRLIFSGKILRFQPDSDKLLPAWLELVLASHKYQKQLDRLKVGSSDSSVSIGNAQVLELTVPVPSLAEQKTLVGNVENMKSLAERFEREIEQEVQKFKQLRRALLHVAFSGNIGSK